MPIPSKNVHLFPSTKWEFRKVKVRTAPAGDSPATGGTAPSPARRKRDAHKPLTVTVQYRGGPSASWLIRYRGLTHRFEGHLAIHDVLSWLSEASWEHGQAR
jgi:hypothetical protein